MKILELTNFSSGICGVWSRVREESIRLSKLGHKVVIFSSNFIKGSNETASAEENIQGVAIKRFPAIKLGGESFLHWNFESAALEFKPDIIIAHCYRHLHTTKALKLKKKLNCKVFLVTHAPFVENNSTRSFFAKVSVNFYDSFIGPRKINQFDKVIAITHWEYSYLKKLNLSEEKIVYIPNGIPEEFLNKKRKFKEEKKILFLGRISPIKNLEVLIKALSLIKDKKIKLEIVGPSETDYLEELKILVKELELEKRVIFSGPVFDLSEKIKKIDSAKIFVLPSKREAMPQALIEAMAREKIVIASDNLGSREIISHGKTGFIFRNNDEKDLAEKIDFVIDKDFSNVAKLARKEVEKYSWNKTIQKIQKVISS